MSDIFISYASKDQEFADKLVSEIELRGLKCWISSRDIKPGSDYQGAIAHALEGAGAFLLLFSQNANTSQEIPRELALASKYHKTVIPARIEDILPSGALAYSITNAQFVDLFRGFEKAVNRLCVSLTETMQISEQRKLDIKRAGRNRKLRKVFMRGGSALALLAFICGGWALWPLVPHHYLQPSENISATPTLPNVVAAPNTPSPASAVAQAPAIEPRSSTPPAAAAIAPLPQTAPSTGPTRPAFSGNQSPETVASALAGMQPQVVLGQAPPLLNNLSAPLSASDAERILSNTFNDQRAQFLHLLAPYLVQNLDAADASNLLAGTNNSLANALTYLLPDLQITFSAPDIATLINGLSNQDRLVALRQLLPRIASGLSADDVVSLTSGTNNQLLEAMQLLAFKLARPIDAISANQMLNGLSNADCLQGISTLEPLLKHDLSGSDVASLLSNTNNSRLDALKVLQPNLQTPITAASVVDLLSGLGNADRLQGINTIYKNLPAVLNASDVVSILDGTNNSRLDALAVLQPNLQMPITAASAVNLLSGLNNADRLRGINTIYTNLPSGLSAPDAVSILDGTNNSRLDALHDLEPKIATISYAMDVANLLSGMGNMDYIEGLKILSSKLPKNLSESDITLLSGPANNYAGAAQQILKNSNAS